MKGYPEWAPDESLDFTVNGSAFPTRAEYRLDVGLILGPDVKLCLRLFDTTRNEAVAGREGCWEQPPAAGERAVYEEYGPFKLAPTRDRYTLQAHL